MGTSDRDDDRIDVLTNVTQVILHYVPGLNIGLLQFLLCPGRIEIQHSLLLTGLRATISPTESFVPTLDFV